MKRLHLQLTTDAMRKSVKKKTVSAGPMRKKLRLLLRRLGLRKHEKYVNYLIITLPNYSPSENWQRLRDRPRSRQGLEKINQGLKKVPMFCQDCESCRAKVILVDSIPPWQEIQHQQHYFFCSVSYVLSVIFRPDILCFSALVQHGTHKKPSFCRQALYNISCES